MAENEKNKINELESSADSLLARLSGHFEPSSNVYVSPEKQEDGASGLDTNSKGKTCKNYHQRDNH